MGYRGIDHAFGDVDISTRDVLVDVGCARGRVLNYWLSRALPNRLVGIELIPDIAARTRGHLRRYPQVEILTGDAVALTPADATVCLLFNPFGGPVVRRWHDATLARATGHRLTVVYVRPLTSTSSIVEAVGHPSEARIGFGDVAIADRMPARWRATSARVGALERSSS